LDVYHALGHLSDTGKVLYKEGTEEYKQWQSVAINSTSNTSNQ